MLGIGPLAVSDRPGSAAHPLPACPSPALALRTADRGCQPRGARSLTGAKPIAYVSDCLRAGGSKKVDSQTLQGIRSASSSPYLGFSIAFCWWVQVASADRVRPKILVALFETDCDGRLPIVCARHVRHVSIDQRKRKTKGDKQSKPKQATLPQALYTQYTTSQLWPASRRGILARYPMLIADVSKLNVAGTEAVSKRCRWQRDH